MQEQKGQTANFSFYGKNQSQELSSLSGEGLKKAGFISLPRGRPVARGKKYLVEKPRKQSDEIPVLFLSICLLNGHRGALSTYLDVPRDPLESADVGIRRS